MSFNLNIPASDQSFNITLENGTSTVFVGANGSGKSRLAIHIENQIGESAHRISAHRALTLNPNVPKISEKHALNGLKFGHAVDEAFLYHRSGARWNDRQATFLLNDFDHLIQALFAEQYRIALQTHDNARAGVAHTAQATKFEQLKIIWQALIPHRKLVVNGDNIQVLASEDSPLYSAAEMSDGERAVFYLIGQVLVASEDSLLVIDEPELHVHRSIMGNLWDQLQIARPDCALLFITHDLDFAASRVGSKFVIRDYTATPNEQWSIEGVPEDTGFSEDITTLLLGSRRPILFIEGDTKSLDIAVYRCVYPQWTVVPRGSCQDVIHAVATMRANAALTRIRCVGIVDADDFDASDADHLRKSSIFVLPVSEIENLFMLPEISREIARTEHFNDKEIDDRLAALADDIFAIVSQPGIIESAVRRYCLRRIDRFLKKTDLSRAGSVDDICDAYDKKILNLDIKQLAQNQHSVIAAAFTRRDLAAALSLIDNKGMLAQAARRLKNTSRDVFEAWLMRALHIDRTPDLIAALHRALPAIDDE
jgi:AAA domain, putative AbiEii toxin, Type IV TA system/Protein of unknown function (DUF4435)